MRLARLADGRTAFLVPGDEEDHVVSLAAVLAAVEPLDPTLFSELWPWTPAGWTSWVPLIEDWDSRRGSMAELAGRAADDVASGAFRFGARPLSAVPLGAPLPDLAGRVYAMGGNFPSHSAGMAAQLQLPKKLPTSDAGDPPWGFFVIPGTVVGHEAHVTAPSHVRKLDYEAEVAIVRGPGEQASEDELPVWGYTAWNDFSIRDGALGLVTVDHGPLTWSLTKNFRSGNSAGPCLVVDDGPPVDSLDIACRVNGDARQKGNTGDMLHSFGAVASHISEYSPLSAGDMILSGTPAGTAMEQGIDGPFLADGDLVEVTVSGIGTLRNRVTVQP